MSKATVAAWAKQATHEVQLPSGATCTVKLPNVAQIVLGGDFPSSLRDAAMRELTGKPTQELTEAEIKDAYEFSQYLVLVTVVEPKLALEDLDILPQEDLELISAFANRQQLPTDYLVTDG